MGLCVTLIDLTISTVLQASRPGVISRKLGFLHVIIIILQMMVYLYL